MKICIIPTVPWLCPKAYAKNIHRAFASSWPFFSIRHPETMQGWISCKGISQRGMSLDDLPPQKRPSQFQKPWHSQNHRLQVCSFHKSAWVSSKWMHWSSKSRHLLDFRMMYTYCRIWCIKSSEGSSRRRRRTRVVVIWTDWYLWTMFGWKWSWKVRRWLLHLSPYLMNAMFQA